MYKVNKGIWAVVPCKKLEHSNGRLMAVLSGPERRDIACSMLEDVLKPLANLTDFEGVLVVSDDPMVKSIAGSLGAGCLENYVDTGLSSALKCASHFLAEKGAQGIVAVHADLPLLTTEDITLVIRSIAKSPAVTVVPAERDLGTNVLAMSPPGFIEYAYGKRSSQRHAMAARARRINPKFFHTPRLGFDLDTPADLLTFLRNSSDTNTFQYLAESGIRDRLLGPKTKVLQSEVVG